MMKEKGKTDYYRIKIRYIGTCGHETAGYCSNIKNNNTLMCINCSREKTAITLKERTKEDRHACMHLEHKGYSLMKDALKDTFIVEKTYEGCLSDMMVKPSTEKQDKWLMIQLKTTAQPTYKLYSFSINNRNYSDCALVCMCFSNNKTWIFDGLISKHMNSKLNIGIGKSKYSKYETKDNEEIVNTILELYKSKTLFDRDTCLLPRNIWQQREQRYRRLREEKVDFLQYEYPEVEGLIFDFTVNDTKFQEKVGGYQKKKKVYTAFLAVRNGVKAYRSYRLGENDFYWVWLEDTSMFGLFPEKVLFDQKLISEANVTIERKIIYMNFRNEEDWFHEYIFDYNNFNKDKFVKLLEYKK